VRIACELILTTYPRRSLLQNKPMSHSSPTNITSITIGTTAAARTIDGPRSGCIDRAGGRCLVKIVQS